MPSIHSHQPSPYAEPNTPIASAKRPRTAIKHTGEKGTPHHTTTGGSRHASLLQSPPPACQFEQISPHNEEEEGGAADHDKYTHTHQKQQHPDEAEGEAGARSEGGGSSTREGGADGNEKEGTWKGRVVSLFSPVLKFVGGVQQGGEGEEEIHHHKGGEGGIGNSSDHENDRNWENIGSSRLEKQQEQQQQQQQHTHTHTHHSHPHSTKVRHEHPSEEGGEAGAAVAAKVEDEDVDGMDVVVEEDEIAPPAGEGNELEEGNEDLDEELEEDEEEEEDDDDLVAEEFNPFLFIKQLPPYEHVAIADKICLPKRKPAHNTRSASSSPVTLVLDLDETLVHCTVEPVPDPDVVFPVEFNGISYQVHVRKRPHLEEFLLKVSKMFEVVVFTASQQVYADALLNIIDPQHKLIKHRLFRDACLPVEGNYIKDLNVLGRDIAKTVLIDNSPYAYGYQLDNGIPIESWFEDREDMELLKLLPFLEELQRVEDVRPLIRSTFQSHVRVEEA